MKLVKKFLILLACLLLVAGTVSAAEGTGSIRVTFCYRGEPVAGGSLTLYRAEDLGNLEDPEEMAAYAQEHGIQGDTKTADSAGQVRFTDLAPGVYLLVQRQAPPGFLPVKPFLVQVDSGESRVDAGPKMAPEPEPELPQTGQLWWPAAVLGTAGTALLALGLWMQRNERKTRKE